MKKGMNVETVRGARYTMFVSFHDENMYTLIAPVTRQQGYRNFFYGSILRYNNHLQIT